MPPTKAPRRPSLDRNQALSFYSGKVPAGAGARKKMTSKPLPASENKPVNTAAAVGAEKMKQAIPDYCRPTAPKVVAPVVAPVAPKTTARFDKKGKMVKRASLSEQLASIGASVGNITADIRKTHNLPVPAGGNSDQQALLTTPSKSFSVGTCRCAFPSPVTFYSDRCVYTFHHPFAKTEVYMEMFFRDMASVQLLKPVSAVGEMKFRFKIMKVLKEFLGV